MRINKKCASLYRTPQLEDAGSGPLSVHGYSMLLTTCWGLSFDWLGRILRWRHWNWGRISSARKDHNIIKSQPMKTGENHINLQTTTSRIEETPSDWYGMIGGSMCFQVLPIIYGDAVVCIDDVNAQHQNHKWQTTGGEHLQIHTVFNI